MFFVCKPPAQLYLFIVAAGICYTIKRQQLDMIHSLRTLIAAGALATGIQANAADNNIVSVAAGNEDFSTLVAAVQAAGLVDTLAGEGPFTVFAPTNEAFAKLPEGTVETLLKPENKDTLVEILTYHVVAAKVPAAAVETGIAGTVAKKPIFLNKSEEGVTVNGANVIAADVAASNGVIHVIDEVILPDNAKTLADLVAGTEGFSTLLAALKAAGLDSVVATKGPFTVFAPTDEAFAKLPENTIPTLLKPENKDQLANILLYHVVPGVVMAKDVKAGEVKAANDGTLGVTVSDWGVKINDSKVIKTDIEALNGVVHVIDTVLLP